MCTVLFKIKSANISYCNPWYIQLFCFLLIFISGLLNVSLFYEIMSHGKVFLLRKKAMVYVIMVSFTPIQAEIHL